MNRDAAEGEKAALVELPALVEEEKPQAFAVA